MIITLVAGDFMQSEEFRAIGTAMEEGGHVVNMFLADGKPPTFTNEKVEREIAGSGFVLLAVSNNFDETLRAGQRAIQLGIPYGIYAASGPGCYLGENLKPLRSSAKLVLVFNENEIEPARELFLSAKVVASGSPNWEKFFFPEKTREEARDLLEIKDDEICVLVPGDKDLRLNILLFAATIEAAEQVSETLRRRVRVIIGLHPGDPNHCSSYTDLGKYVPHGVSVTFISRNPQTFTEGVDLKIMPTAHALPGADVLVNFTSTLGYEASCQRIPVICIFPRYGAIWLLKEAGYEPAHWEQCRNGTAIGISGLLIGQLANTVSALLMTDGPSPMRQTQERVYPAPPTKGSAVKAVVRALESFQK